MKKLTTYLFGVACAVALSAGAAAQPVLVSIDIKPGSDPNSINPFSRGVIPVAILSSNHTGLWSGWGTSGAQMGRTSPRRER
jgi:hypothetical protein